MKATFDIAGEGQFPNQPSFELAVCFNGVPGKVVLEASEISFNGYSGSVEDPKTRQARDTRQVMRLILAHSEARAIASALLSAATEAKQP